MTREVLGKKLFTFCNKPIVLHTLDENVFMWSLYDSDLFNFGPKCFCWKTWLTTGSLKWIEELWLFYPVLGKLQSQKFLPGKFSPIKLTPGEFPLRNSHPENSHLEYSRPYI